MSLIFITPNIANTTSDLYSNNRETTSGCVVRIDSS